MNNPQCRQNNNLITEFPLDKAIVEDCKFLTEVSVFYFMLLTDQLCKQSSTQYTDFYGTGILSMNTLTTNKALR